MYSCSRVSCLRACVPVDVHTPDKMSCIDLRHVDQESVARAGFRAGSALRVAGWATPFSQH